MAKKTSAKVKSYSGKLLLFGEHIINLGARGLAIPTDRFSGSFRYVQEVFNEEAIISNKSLQTLTEYIIYDDRLSKLYDTNALLTDLERGLYFASDIPQGYGMGSSGAVVAAVCDQYRKTDAKKLPHNTLKSELAQMESCFHGRSSGLDPLVCYLHKSVLIDSGEVSEVFDLKLNVETRYKVFVIDSGKPRKSAALIKLFLEKYKDPAFEKLIQQSLVKANEVCIDAFLLPKYPTFWKSVKLISQIHYDYLGEFIPDALKPNWRQGLIQNDFYLKICGAGGGGFILGFAKKDFPVDEVFKKYQVLNIMDF